ncbi:MAG: TonB-dependent receptor plug domain-containing protein, partial [Candidatus Thiodiazotropha sp.]
MSLDAPVGVAEETLPTLVVTATRVERELFDTPQAVTLVDSMEVEEYNVTSTPDLFDFATGVYIQKTNLGGGSPFIRGLTGKQVVILVDGVRLNNSYY